MSLLDSLFGAGDDWIDRKSGAVAADVGAQLAAQRAALAADLDRATTAAAWKLGAAGVVVALVGALAYVLARRASP